MPNGFPENLSDMAEEMNIGLVQRGTVDWVGGIELEKNLIEATRRYAEKEGKTVQFTLLGQRGSDSNKRSIAGDAFEKLNQLEWPPPDSERTKDLREGTWRSGIFRRSKEKTERLIRIEDRDNKGRYLKEAGVDFIYPPFVIPTDYQKHSATWICDFQHKFLPEYFSGKEIARRDKLFQSLATRVDVIVVSSETAVGHYREFYPSAEVDLVSLPFRIILPEGLFEKDPTPVPKKYHLPENFFVVCNQFWEHKNHTVVLDAVEKLIADGVDCTVAMTGRIHDDRNPQYAEGLLTEIQQRGLYQNIRVLGLVPKEDQLQLIRTARAVIQPSFFEGWSTIVEESHALGAKMILSDLPVHREQTHPSAVFFDPRNRDELCDAMRQEMELPSSGASMGAPEYPDLILKFGKQFYDLAASKSRS